jgi:probable HAF family extracellular repeat protein
MSRHSRAVAVCILVLGGCLSLSGIPAAAPRITITDLGTLGGDWAQVFDMNEAGQVTGESETADGAIHAYFWTAAGGMVDLGVLPGQEYSEALALNDAGQVVGHSAGRAFSWTEAGGMVDIGGARRPM